MKSNKKLNLLLILISLITFAYTDFANAAIIPQEKTNKTKTESKADTDKSSDKKESDKLICIVTKEEADPALSMEYKGKVYHFCCKKCVKKFKENPEKYIKKS